MYRTPPEPARPCHAHPTSEAVTQCTTCRVALCGPCIGYAGFRVVCRRCGGGIAQTRRRLSLAAGALLLGLMVVGAAWIGVAWRDAHLSGPASVELRRLRELRRAAPCDAVPLEVLIERLQSVGDYRSAKETLDGALLECARTPAVAALAFRLHYAVGDYDSALRDVNGLFVLEPDRADHYVARARVHFAAGRPKSAIHDYVAALRLPRVNTDFVLRELVILYVQTGRPQAARLLERVLASSSADCTAPYGDVFARPSFLDLAALLREQLPSELESARVYILKSRCPSRVFSLY